MHVRVCAEVTPCWPTTCTGCCRDAFFTFLPSPDGGNYLWKSFTNNWLALRYTYRLGFCAHYILPDAAVNLTYTRTVSDACQSRNIAFPSAFSLLVIQLSECSKHRQAKADVDRWATTKKRHFSSLKYYDLDKTLHAHFQKLHLLGYAETSIEAS
jgi:hypothetical protein